MGGSDELLDNSDVLEHDSGKCRHHKLYIL